MRSSSISRAGVALVLMAALVVPAAALTAPSTAAAATAANNKTPGVTLPATRPLTGSVDSVKDPWDVYKMPLQAGDEIRLTLNGTSKGKAYAFLLPPNSTKVNPANAVAMPVFEAHPAHYPQVMRFGAKTAGVYSLVIFGTESKYSVDWDIWKSEADDDVPGIPLQPSHTGSVSASEDPSDVFAIDMTAGQAISAELQRPADADVNLFAFGPDSDTVWYSTTGNKTSPWPNNAAASSSPLSNGTTERLFFVAPKNGRYYLQAAAFTGAGDYTIATKVLDAGALTDVVWTPGGILKPNTPISVSGKLVNEGGAPHSDKRVLLERLDAKAGTWRVADEATTTAEGGFVLASELDRNSTMRVRYMGEFGMYAPVMGDSRDFALSAELSKPSAPSRVKAGKKFTVKGTVGPRRAINSKPVSIQFQKKVKGKWVTQKTPKPPMKPSGAKSSYSFKTSLPKGYWRIVAQQPATNWQATTSEGRYLWVR